MPPRFSPHLWIPKTATTFGPPGTTTTGSVGKHLTPHRNRKEALSLYREILRTAKHFHWKDEKSGQPWNKLLKEKARAEFQEAKNETDPLIIARMLVTGRDCVHQIQNKFNTATTAAWERIEKDSSRRS